MRPCALRRPRTPTRGARSSSPFPQPKCICLLTYKRPFCYITQIETGNTRGGALGLARWPLPPCGATRLPCLHVAPPAPRRLRVQLRRAAARRRKRESRGAQKSRSCKYLLWSVAASPARAGGEPQSTGTHPGTHGTAGAPPLGMHMRNEGEEEGGARRQNLRRPGPLSPSARLLRTAARAVSRPRNLPPRARGGVGCGMSSAERAPVPATGGQRRGVRPPPRGSRGKSSPPAPR